MLALYGTKEMGQLVAAFDLAVVHSHGHRSCWVRRRLLLGRGMDLGCLGIAAGSPAVHTHAARTQEPHLGLSYCRVGLGGAEEEAQLGAETGLPVVYKHCHHL